MPAMPQQFERGRFGNLGIVLSMFGVQLRDGFPRDLRNTFAAGDYARDINLDRIHAGNVVNHNPDGALIGRRNRCAPFALRKSFSESRQGGSAFFNAGRQQFRATARGAPKAVNGRAVWTVGSLTAASWTLTVFSFDLINVAPLTDRTASCGHCSSPYLLYGIDVKRLSRPPGS